MKVSIVIPACNEEKRIRKTLEEYLRFFSEIKKKTNLDFEILIVINNTQDKTEEIVIEFTNKYKELRYLNFKQGGKGFAIIEGFKDSLKRDNDLIGFVDADLATPPEAYYDLIENIGNFMGVIADRWIKGAKVKKQTLKRQIISRGFNFIVRVFFIMPYKDTQCGAKLFRREVIDKIIPTLNLTQWAFDVNLLYVCKKNKFKIKSVPTTWEEIPGSNINILRAPLQMFLGVMRLRLVNSIFEPILRPVKFILVIGDRLINQ